MHRREDGKDTHCVQKCCDICWSIREYLLLMPLPIHLILIQPALTNIAQIHLQSAKKYWCTKDAKWFLVWNHFFILPICDKNNGLFSKLSLCQFCETLYLIAPFFVSVSLFLFYIALPYFLLFQNLKGDSRKQKTISIVRKAITIKRAIKKRSIEIK